MILLKRESAFVLLVLLGLVKNYNNVDLFIVYSF